VNILHTVESYHPSIGGMQEVVRQISERLVKLGHTVTVATSRSAQRVGCKINGVNIIEFDISGNSADGFHGDVDSYRKFLLGSNYDIISNFAAQQWATDIMLPILDKLNTKKVLIPTGFSGLYIRKFRKYFIDMKEYMQKYDMNVFLSNDYRDINYARSHGISNIITIPNGAGKDEFASPVAIDIRKKYNIPVEDYLILHVGSHTGSKGHAEAIKIFNRARIRKATLLIVANTFGGGCTISCNLRKLLFNKVKTYTGVDKRLLVLTLSRDETIAAYHQADLFLFPSNIECSPIVLFECMASKTPFLVTDVGNASEIITWSGGGALLPTRMTRNGFSRARIRGSVSMLEDLWLDQGVGTAMAQAGFNAWQERFTWERIAAEYEKLYSDLLQAGAGAPK
jgi:L-malate glycosyltransferase